MLSLIIARNEATFTNTQDAVSRALVHLRGIMKLRKYNQGDLGLVQDAVVKLRQARDLLKKAGVTRATDKVRTALKSAEGAERHTSRIAFFSELEAGRG